MTIRGATRHDIGAVLELWATSRSAAASTVDTDEAVAQLLEHDPEAVLVAQEDGRVVGTVIASWDGWRGGIYRLAVTAAQRRRGIGRALVASAEASLSRRGCRRISVIVGAAEDDAMAFWAAEGYVHDAHMARLHKNLD